MSTNVPVRVKVPLGMLKSYYAKVTARNNGTHPTYGAVKDMGAAVKGYLTVTSVSGEVAGDNRTMLRADKFLSGQLDVETTLSDLAINAELRGHTYSEANGEISGGDDTAPEVGYAYIEPILKQDKTTIYRASFYYLCTATVSSEKNESDTRKNDFNPKNNSVSFFVDLDDANEWRLRQDYDTLAAAEAAITALFGGTGPA